MGVPNAMAVGFVLISAAPSKEHEVYNALLKVPEIVELHPLFGEYDLIAKIEGSDFDTLGHIIVNKIRTIEGVMDTKTLTGTRFQMVLSDAAAVFSGVLVLSFGLTILLCGMFTSYFGAGKSRKIGMGLVIVGLLTLFAWITITFAVPVFGTIDAWNAQQMTIGIAGVAAGALGGLVAMAMFLVAIMRA